MIWAMHALAFALLMGRANDHAHCLISTPQTTVARVADFILIVAYVAAAAGIISGDL